MTPTFSAADRATWGETLFADEVAEILGRKVGGLKKSCQERHCYPAPRDTRPWRWRKADVIRYLDAPQALRMKPRRKTVAA